MNRYFSWFKNKKIFTIILFLSLPIFLYVAWNYIANRQQAAETPSTPLARGISGDMWADVVLGKNSFNETTPFKTVPTRLFVPSGTFVDRSVSPNRFYIYDSGNNRILGFSDLNSCVAKTTNPLNCTPDLVIGQPSSRPTQSGFGNQSNCNGDSAWQSYPTRTRPSATSLCLLREDTISLIEGGSSGSMDTDSQGNLYVVDFWNNRILKFNSPFTTDTIADDVWGQNDFISNGCNKSQTAPDATTLCFTFTNGSWVGGVDIDSAGNLWVNDNNNHRILRFPPNSHTANYVLGQTSFTTRVGGSGLNQLFYPGPVRMADNGKLYVADTVNNRVLSFSGPFDSTTYGKSGVLFGSNFLQPNSIDFDPTNPGRVWILSAGYSVLELWDLANQTKIKEIGVRNNGNILGRSSGSVGFDSSGKAYVSARLGDYMSSVLMFAPSVSLTNPDKYFFQPTHDGNSPSQDTLAGNRGVVVSDNQLIVADTGRLMFWNNPTSVTTGKPADGAVIGTFTSTFRSCCYTLKADKNHHLWVTSQREGDYPDRIDLYTLPLTNGQQPVKTIKLPMPILGGQTLTFVDDTFWGLHPTDNSEFLWVSQPSASRVFRIRSPLSATPVVDVILGQSNGSDKLCNRGQPSMSGATANSLCYPSSLSVDNLGNLWVSDHVTEAGGNRRLLVFNKALFPTTNTTPIFAPNASKIFANIGVWGPVFESDGKMIVGFDPWDGFNPRHGRFLAVYNSPQTLTSLSTPDAYFNDYYSTPYAVAIDDQHNVYSTDLNRGRLLIYKNPLGYAVTQPTNSPVPPTSTPTPSNSPLATPTPTRTPTPTVTLSPTPSTLDTIKPTVSITNPTNGAIVTRRSTVTITATASDNLAVDRVQFSVAGNVHIDYTSPYSYSWSVSGKPNSSYIITAIAYDARGNSASHSISVSSRK